jgi:hypothetical protein
MVVDPPPTPVTTPDDASTVATAGALERQVTPCGALFCTATVALICTVPPMSIVVALG